MTLDEQIRIELDIMDAQLKNSLFDYEALNSKFFTTLDKLYKVYDADTPDSQKRVRTGLVEGLYDKQIGSTDFLTMVSDQIDLCGFEELDAKIVTKNLGLSVKSLINLAVTDAFDDVLILLNDDQYVLVLKTRAQITIMMKAVLDKIEELESYKLPSDEKEV